MPGLHILLCEKFKRVNRTAERQTKQNKHMIAQFHHIFGYLMGIILTFFQSKFQLQKCHNSDFRYKTF